MADNNAAYGNGNNEQYGKSLGAGGDWVTPEDIPEPPSDYVVVGSAASETANIALINTWKAMFDDLPYTSRVDLGPATNPGVDLPDIYEYQFGNPDGTPVLIIAGLHGNETKTIACAYWLAWCCENSNTDYFKWMKANVNLRIIPWANPQGTALYQRRNNANNSGTDSDVDINRNFEWRWGSSSDIATVFYRGGSAASELETQYLRLRMSTIVTCVGTITGTILAGDEVTQSVTQAKGVVVSNTGSGASATLVIRMTSLDWKFETGTTTGFPIVKSAGNEQATPLVTIDRFKPALFIDCHNTGNNTNQNIEPQMANFQVPHDYRIDHILNNMASPIIADAGTGQLAYFGINTLKHASATGMSVNYAASLGIQAYTFEVHDQAWEASTTSATKEMVRAHVGAMSAAIVLAEQADTRITREQNILLTGPTAQTYGAIQVYGPDVGDDQAWTRNDYNGLATDYSDLAAGKISLPTLSDVTLTLSGTARGSGAAPRLTIKMWLDDDTDTELGTFSTITYFADCADGKYEALNGPLNVYHSIAAGTYKIRVSVDPSAANALVFGLHVQVRVVPVDRLEPYYQIL